MAPPSSDGGDDDARFRPPPIEAAPLLIEVDAPAPIVRSAAPLAPSAPAPDEPTRCERHDLLNPCPDCVEENRPIPGRLLKGALRRQPLVRIGAGLVLGLLVGWLIAQPYANRAERRVAEVRAEANRNRYWNAEDKQQLAAQLDAQAEDLSDKAALRTIAIWLLVGGAVVAGWFRAT